MNVQLRPELERFIDGQVKSGRFHSLEEVINFAVARLRAEENLMDDELDSDDLAAIEEGLAQANRGEGRPWETLRSELRAKYLK